MIWFDILSRFCRDPFSDRSCSWVVEMNGACEAHFTLFRIRVSLSLPGGNKQAGPRRISSPPVPQTPPPPDGMCEESRSPIGPGSCPSPLIPDALMGRWRWWAGAAKTIIRSFELRLLASLSATMNPEMISMIVTMNGWWSRGQSQRSQSGVFDSRPTGGEESSLWYYSRRGSRCVCLRASLWASVKPSERRWAADRATRLACKPIRRGIAHNEFHVRDFMLWTRSARYVGKMHSIISGAMSQAAPPARFDSSDDYYLLEKGKEPVSCPLSTLWEIDPLAGHERRL